jgi:hypothetical protein
MENTSVVQTALWEAMANRHLRTESSARDTSGKLILPELVSRQMGIAAGQQDYEKWTETTVSESVKRKGTCKSVCLFFPKQPQKHTTGPRRCL